jgi:phospholipase/lecithinase/hemolysin
MTTSLKEELKQTPIAFGCTNETTFMQTTCSSDAITEANVKHLPAPRQRAFARQCS